MRKILIAAAVLVLLTGCVAGELMQSIRPGMTRDQVTAVLGEPNGMRTVGELTELQYTNRLISGWSWDRSDFTVTLQDGKVVAYGAGDVRSRDWQRPETVIVVPSRY